MSKLENLHDDEEFHLGEFLRPVLAYRGLILLGTAIVVTTVAAWVAYAWVSAPVARTVSLGFRPVFLGADGGKYPNGTAFLASDLVAPSIEAQAYDLNGLSKFCSRESFAAGTTVTESSPQLDALDAEVQSRLSDPKLAEPDRLRIVNDYTNRRRLIPIQYRLMFVRLPECSQVPDAIVSKVLNDQLHAWAQESEMKRGVLKLPVAIVSADAFQSADVISGNLLARADLLRSAITRLIANIQELEVLPGAAAVRIAWKADPASSNTESVHYSFADLHNRLQDLLDADLDPLVASAGRGLGGEAARWIDESVKRAKSAYDAAVDRSNAMSTALRDYTLPSSAAPANSRTNSDLPALTPQIDRTFVDRMIELSADNTKFRQELTRSYLDSMNRVVAAKAEYDHYGQLQQAIHGTSGAGISEAEVTRRLGLISREGARLAETLNALYDEFSRVSLRVDSMLYQVTEPARVQTSRAFGLRDIVLRLAFAIVFTPIFLALFGLAHARYRMYLAVSRHT